MVSLLWNYSVLNPFISHLYQVVLNCSFRCLYRSLRYRSVERVWRWFTHCPPQGWRSEDKEIMAWSELEWRILFCENSTGGRMAAANKAYRKPSDHSFSCPFIGLPFICAFIDFSLIRSFVELSFICPFNDLLGEGWQPQTKLIGNLSIIRLVSRLFIGSSSWIFFIDLFISSVL